MRSATPDELRLHARAGQLWAVLDACDQPAVPQKAWELGEARAVSLYRGSAEEDYWDIAPYLAQADEQMLEWVLDTLWREPWGILAVSNANLAEVRTHFRRFLTVRDPQGEEMYFRFYDPRVLTAFLPTCTPGERDQFFGPVSAFYATARRTGELRCITRE